MQSLIDIDAISKSLTNTAAYQGMYDHIVGMWPQQANFNAEASIQTMQGLTPGFPIAMATGYILMVFGGRAIMSGLNKFNTRWAVILWNLLLAVFSIMGAIVTVPYALRFLNGEAGSFGNYLCNPPKGLYDGVAGYWVFLFILSKTPELLDTFFLVVQKKPVIFLHWYHHFTVMLFCWHAWMVSSTAGLYYAAMNFTVHGIMYSYYFFMCFSSTRKLVKPFAQFITTIQILQMVGGMAISLLCFLEMDSRSACIGLDRLNVQAGTIMYISYFILFSAMFKKNYIDKKKKPIDAKAQPASSASATRAKAVRSPSARKN